uniref:Protein mono-ADP-ribosyltransferase PARP14-like isoform X2 n=1 Tax=Petromyzon marinus TaxID=7757 RepID=A0AAJ7SLZ7_PETMA|nr:protein mono-ADP-ribosyltransferase PARP14-like isoform X2 [Petromyzon marinus]
MERGRTAVASNVGGPDDSTSSHVQLMEEETAVLVENLPRDLDKVLKGKLQKYFQSKRSGGGECQLISHRDSKRKAIVKFTSKQVRESVLAKGEHVIEVSSDENVEVHVTAFTASPATPAEPGASIKEKSDDEDLSTSANNKSELSEKTKENTSNKSTDKPEQPKQLEEKLNPYLLKFITSNEEHRSELDRAMEKSRCKIKAVNFDTIWFLPDNESITDHNEWQGSVTKMFTQFTQGYAHETITCTEEEWKEVERKSEQKRDLEVLYKNGIQLTGKSDEVKKIKQKIEDIMSEFNKGSLFTNIEPHYFELLQDDLCRRFPGVQFHMNNNKLCFKGDSTKLNDVNKYIDVSLQDSDKKTCSFGSYLNNFLRKTNLRALVQTHFTGNEIKALCDFDENEIYIYSLQGHAEKAHAILNVILKDLLFPVTKKNGAVMKSEQWNFFFEKLQQNYSKGKYSCIFSIIEHKDGTSSAINIAGIAEAVEKADKDLTSYFKDNTAEEIIPLQNEALCSCIIDYMKIIDHSALKSVSVERHDSLMDIIIMGHVEEVEKHKQSINNVVSKVNKELRKNERGIPDEKSISMFLEKYRRCNSRFSTQNQEEFSSVAGASERPVATQQRPPVRLPGNRFLFVHEENILNLNVDVIVNAANEDLKHLGGLAKVLSDAGGTVIQQESDSYVRKHGKVPTGELAITGPGHLPCKKVFHAVGPEWGDYRRNTRLGIMLLEMVIKNVLEKADEEGFKSIAIPAISAGIFAFPLDICTETFCRAIFDYCKSTQDLDIALTDIHIVDVNHEFISKFRKTIELTMNCRDRSEEQSSNTHEMQDEEDEGQNQEWNFGHHSTEDKVTDWENCKAKDESSLKMDDTENNMFITHEGRHIKVVIGNIEDQHTDIIVKSTSVAMKLDNGGAASAARHKARPSLQDELDRKKNHLGHGSIISTDTAQSHLFCKKVYHIAVQPDEKNKSYVHTIVLDCLKKAHKAKETSISFPALGTGILNCPPQQVARAMLSAAIQFSNQHKDDILQLIQFVILRSKPDIHKAFQNEISSAISKTYSEGTAPSRKHEERFQTGAEHNKKLFKIQGITVELCCGDITQEKTDAIVNSTDARMSMTSGISNAILKAAGQTIKDEFLKEDPSYGDIVVTNAGRLKCKHIVHIAGLNVTIENICERILKECQLRKIKSVSFPAIGTGLGNRSHQQVALNMVNGIHLFAGSYAEPTVTNIRFVFINKELLNIFQDVLNGKF